MRAHRAIPTLHLFPHRRPVVVLSAPVAMPPLAELRPARDLAERHPTATELWIRCAKHPQVPHRWAWTECINCVEERAARERFIATLTDVGVIGLALACALAAWAIATHTIEL